jgi:hypothetical protein
MPQDAEEGSDGRLRARQVVRPDTRSRGREEERLERDQGD